MADKITFKKFAELVLAEEKRPLSPLEIWKRGTELNFTENLSTSGKTPWQTIGAQIYVDIRDNPKSLFYQYSSRPMKFYLNKFKEDFKPEDASSTEDDNESDTKSRFHERDLHPLLTKFVNSDLNFRAYTKTIFHENSGRSQKGLNEWIHPDIVGIKFPFEDFDSSTLTIQKELFWTAVKFYSFELKKEINLGNLRKCYFQAVSNSSWANEGYLVAPKIKDEDGELMSELRRLNNAFGIGIIKLDSENINESEILIPSKIKPELDWDTIDILLRKNIDFRRFMDDVKGDISLGKISNKNNYDKILEDEKFSDYLKEKEIN